MASPLSTMTSLTVFPIIPGTERSPENKRTITPSTEEASPKSSLIFISPSSQPASHHPIGSQLSTSPFFAPRQLFPREVARVAHHYRGTHAYPKPATITRPQEPPPQESPPPSHTRHILLPFDLRDENINILKGQVCQMLCNIFPGITELTVGRNRSYIHFTVSELPKRPWPLTVGGIPITLGDKNNGRGPLFPINI